MEKSVAFKKRSIHWLVLVVGMGLFCVATESDCEAQLFRRHRLNRQRVPSGTFAATKTRIQQSGLHRLVFGTSTQNRAHGYDPYADKYSRYPRYIGAFHSSHFSNIGVPTGDIGFRGNGIYWSPW